MYVYGKEHLTEWERKGQIKTALGLQEIFQSSNLTFTRGGGGHGGFTYSASCNTFPYGGMQPPKPIACQISERLIAH